MRQKNIKKMLLYVFLGGVAFLCLFFIVGQWYLENIVWNKIVFESNLSVLEQYQDSNIPDLRERSLLAIKKYKNKIIDPQPILLYPCLSQAIGTEKTGLYLEIFDEDMDTLGFIIREEVIDSNNILHTLEEEYPVFFNSPYSNVVITPLIPISVRSNNQKKDEQIWEQFLTTDYEYLKEEAARLNDKWYQFFSENILDESLSLKNKWKETLPPIWISIPDINDVTVWIQIYDKAGNKSDFIKLIDMTQHE